MKRLLTVLFAVLLLAGCKEDTTAAAPVADPAHNSRNALDWQGVYRGMMPCADCEGIDTVVTLFEDGSYRLQMRYMGKDADILTETGAFNWDDAGGTIALEQGPKYRVGEDHLTMLDMEGQPIEGELAKHYVLTRVPPASLVETYWKLVTLNGTPVAPHHNEAHMILKSDDSRVAGSTGCNRFMGGYATGEEGVLTFTQMASTKMACIDGMETEGAFLKAVGDVASYEVNGNALTLFDADKNPVAVFEAVYLY